MPRYYIQAFPQKVTLPLANQQNKKIAGIAISDTSQENSIARSNDLNNTTIFGIIAEENTAPQFKLSNTNDFEQSSSHDFLDNKYIIALHNITTGKKAWFNLAGVCGDAHVGQYFEQYKDSYIFGISGPTSGLLKTASFGNYKIPSAGQAIAETLGSFNGPNSEYDYTGDGVINAPDLANVIAKWGSLSKMFNVKAYGYDYLSNNVNLNTGTNKIFEFLDEAATNNNQVGIEFSDSLTSISFLQNVSGITNEYSPYVLKNYPKIPLDGSAVVYWVSPSGSDSNSGLTSNAPVKNLHRAGELLQANSSFNTNNASKKPGYIVLMDGKYNFNTLGYTSFYRQNSATVSTVISTRRGNSLLGYTFNSVTIMAQNPLKAEISGAIPVISFPLINGITSNILYAGLSGISGTSPLFGVTLNNLNDIYLENALITDAPTGGSSDRFSADRTVFLKDTELENYDYDVWNNSEYYPTFKNTQYMIADGKNPKDLIKNSSYFEVVFTRAAYDPSEDFPNGRIPGNVPTSSSIQAWSIDGVTSINCYTNGTYSNGRTTLPLQNHMVFYNWLLNQVPVGKTLTNYFNDSTLYFNTSDNNKAGFRIVGVNPSQKTLTLFGNVLQSGSMDLIYKATILGHPKDIANSYPGQFAIGNTFENGGKYRLLINPFEKVGGVTFADISRIGTKVAEAAITAKNPANTTICGLSIRDTFSKAIETWKLSGDTLDTSLKIKYNLARDTGSNFMTTTLPNNIIESNLILRTKVRPLSISSANNIIKNNVILDWASKTGIMITGDGADNNVIDGNLLFGRDGSHVNSFAVYANAKSFKFINNGTYTLPSENYYGINFNEINSTQLYGIVEDNVFATGTFRPGRGTNRFSFNHNFVRGYENNFYEVDDSNFPWFGVWDCVFRNNIVTSQSSSHFLEYPNFAYLNGGSTILTFNPCDQRTYPTISTVGFTGAIYTLIQNDPGYFLPYGVSLSSILGVTTTNCNGISYSANPNYVGHLLAPRFQIPVDLHPTSSRAAPMVFINPYSEYNPSGLPNFYNNVFLKKASFLNDDYHFGLRRSGGNVVEYVGVSDLEKTSRYLCKNSYHTLNDTVPTIPGSTLSNEIFVGATAYNYKLRDTAKVISHSTPLNVNIFTGLTYNSPTELSVRNTKIIELLDENGDPPGPRWKNHPPSDPYKWWLWQENVGFYGNPI